MNFELTGKMLVKGDTQNVSKNPEKSFNKRDFVLETKETGSGGQEFIQTIPFQITGDRVNLIDVLNVGDEITVSFNIRGRGWRKTEAEPMRYFCNLEAWSVAKAQANAGAGSTLPPMPEDDSDDLPF